MMTLFIHAMMDVDSLRVMTEKAHIKHATKADACGDKRWARIERRACTEETNN